MPSPIPVERFLPRDLSPSIDLRPCSSPLELSRHKAGGLRPAPCRLPPRLAWCRIDWEQVRVLEPLGSGGFGSVYRATYRGQTVALKKVKRCSKNRLASRQSFWAELNAARLCHPHVVRVLAASASCPGDPGSPGTIIMEYAGSGTLHRRIYGRGPPLGRAVCLRYARHVADGLRFLHRGGVVHLDLKPANVLLAPGDLCKIGDFGCSQRLQDGEDGGEAYSAQLRHLGGTYTHRAPELLRGDPVTAKADIYSFAVTLWQMVTRELPYTGDRQCVLYAVVAYDLRPEIGPMFMKSQEGRAARAIIETCWRARPEERPNAEELLQSICLAQSSGGEESAQLEETSEIQEEQLVDDELSEGNSMDDGTSEVQCIDQSIDDGLSEDEVQDCQPMAVETSPVKFMVGGISKVLVSPLMTGGASQLQSIARGPSQVQYQTNGTSQTQFIVSGASPVQYGDNGTSQVQFLSNGTSQVHFINNGPSPVHCRSDGTSQAQFRSDGTSQLHFINNGPSPVQCRSVGRSQVHVTNNGSSPVQCRSNGTSQALFINGLSPVQCRSDGTSQAQFIVSGASQVHFLSTGTSQDHFINNVLSPVQCRSDGTSQLHFINDETSQVQCRANETSQVLLMANGTFKPRGCHPMSPGTCEIKKCHHVGDGTFDLQGGQLMSPGTSKFQRMGSNMDFPNSAHSAHLQEVFSCS